jgi:enamine deaminase RidA (YjgF/YER057c/UK114 family)
MIASGMIAVPCKVASMGLSAKMLGKPLAEIQPQLARAARAYQVNICGEGGEYETLTLACPGLFLPGAAVDLQSPAVHFVSRDRFSPVAHLVVSDAVVTGAEASSYRLFEGDDALAESVALVAPRIRDSTVQAHVEAAIASLPGHHVPPASQDAAASSSGIVSARGHAAVVASVCKSTESVDETMAHLLRRLQSRGASWSDVVFVRLWVRDMGDFGGINAAYCRFFGRHPPSRACVQQAAAPSADAGAAGGSGAEVPRVTVEAIAVRGAGMAARGTRSKGEALTEPWSGEPIRHVHHVQTQSHWAPLCIGPYCQANVVAGNVLCAGQIGLDPGTMALVPGGPLAELGRAMLSSARVLAAERSALQTVTSCVLFVSEAALPADKEAAGELLRELHAECARWLTGAALPGMTPATEKEDWEEEDAPAGYVLGAKLGASSAAAAAAHADGSGDWAGLDMREFDCGEGWGAAPSAAVAHVLVSVVPRLPRDALVEVELAGVTREALRASLQRGGSAAAGTEEDVSDPALVSRAMRATERAVAGADGSPDLVLYGRACVGVGGSCAVYARRSSGGDWPARAREAVESFAAEQGLTGSGSARVLVSCREGEAGEGQWAAAVALAAALAGGDVMPCVHPVLCGALGTEGEWRASVHVVWVTGACAATDEAAGK